MLDNNLLISTNTNLEASLIKILDIIHNPKIGCY